MVELLGGWVVGWTVGSPPGVVGGGFTSPVVDEGAGGVGDAVEAAVVVVVLDSSGTI